MARKIGSTAYASNEHRYHGKVTILAHKGGDTYEIRDSAGNRGTISGKNLFSTAKDAKAQVRGMVRGGWADAAKLSRYI